MSQQPVTSIFNRKVFADRLTKVRNNASLTRDEVVALSNNGFARSSLQAWEVGDREPKIDNIFELAKIYGISPQYLIFGDTDAQTTQQLAPDSEMDSDDVYRISIYDIEASAGHGCFSEWATQKGYEPVRRSWIKSQGVKAENLAIIYTSGDSMTPTIPEGSSIIVDTSCSTAFDGKIYVIRIEDRLFVKRVQWLPTGGLRLISDNKFYDPLDITKEDMQANDVQVCGQVIHVSHDIS